MLLTSFWRKFGFPKNKKYFALMNQPLLKCFTILFYMQKYTEKLSISFA